MIEHYLNRPESTYDSKHLILVIFDSEWAVIQTMQLILLIVCTNLSILLHYRFFGNYFVRILRLKIINTCVFVISNCKMRSRIKLLIDILKKTDSLWINRFVNGNLLNDDLNECPEVLDGLKSIL